MNGGKNFASHSSTQLFSHTALSLALEDRLFCLFDKARTLQSQNLGNSSPHFMSIAASAWVILDPTLFSVMWLIQLMGYIHGQMIVVLRDRS